MEPDLKISIKGLSGELANNVGKAVASLLNTFDGRLDLRRMRRIVIAEDFAGELASLSSMTASKGPITYTNEDFAIAVAKVLLIPNGNACEILPVINARVAKILTEQEQNPKGFEHVVHLLHHELCHVHDDNKQLDAFPDVLLRHRYIGKDTFLGPLTERCWSEYIANFLSSSTATNDSVSMIVESFIDALKRTKEETDLRILRYRFDGKLDDLLSDFRKRGEFLPASAAYVLGYIDGLGKTLEEISPQAPSVLAGSYFGPVWLALQSALRELRKNYPEGWQSFSIFEPLKTALESYYSTMGLVLSTVEEGRAYVDIPMRLETNPLLNPSKLQVDWMLGRKGF